MKEWNEHKPLEMIRKYREFVYARGGVDTGKGKILETVPTRPGLSYHAYPWRGDLPGRTGLPRWILRKLRQIAKRKGEEKEMEKWLKKYGGPGK
jgi:hypothetical protein